MNMRRAPWQHSIRADQPNLAAYVNRKLRVRHWKAGVRACESCGWTAPPGVPSSSKLPCLILHHIIPIARQGSLEQMENTAILCPNHAKIADVLGAKEINIKYEYFGPKTRPELFRRLRELDKRGPVILSAATKAMEGLNAD